MSEITRAVVIVAVVAFALGATGLWAGYRARGRRSAISTESLRPWPAAVLFTSADCDACDPVRSILSGCASGDVVREVVYEGSAGTFRSAGVDSVPVVVVIDDRGTPIGVYEGQVTARQIERVLRRAGLQ
ncbi:MAG: hypothetical protein ACXW15_01020 [Acidimicrobiia bacterium]